MTLKLFSVGIPRLRFGEALVCLMLCSLGTFTIAAPYQPASTDEVLLKLDGNVQQALVQQALRARAQTATRSAQPEVAAKLAQEFIDLGRSQNDERYFGYAAAILQPWTTIATAPTNLTVLRADVAQHQHRFMEAQKILDELIAHDGNHAGARLMRASLRMTLGQPKLAQPDCQRLFALRESFAAAICIAQVTSLTGKLSTSYAVVKDVLQRSAADINANQYRWALGIAGEMAERLGNQTEAQLWFRKALALSPNDLVSRLQLCDLLLHTRQPQQVLTLLIAAPASEPVLLRRALAAQQLQDDTLTKKSLAAWQAAVMQSDQIGVRLHLRELARGQLDLLNAPQAALTTAIANWEIQREPVDARLLVAAARAAGNGAVLKQMREWQRDLQLEDVGLNLETAVERGAEPVQNVPRQGENRREIEHLPRFFNAVSARYGRAMRRVAAHPLGEREWWRHCLMPHNFDVCVERSTAVSRFKYL